MVSLDTSDELNKVLIYILFIASTILFAAGLCEFIYAIWFISSQFDINEDIRFILYDGNKLQESLGLFFTMPIAGSIQTISLFILSLIIHLKWTRICKCDNNTNICLCGKMCGGSLTTYIVVTSILSVVYIIIGSVALSKVPSFNTELKASMEHSLKVSYSGYPQIYKNTDKLSKYWDGLMLRGKCCGVNGQADFIAGTSAFKATQWRWHTNSMTYKLPAGTTYTDTQIQIPTACCMVKDDVIKTSEDISMDNLQSNLQSESCPVDLSQSYNTGCIDQTVQVMTEYVIWTHTLLLVIGFDYLLLIAIAIVLYNRTKFGKIEQKDDSAKK